MIIDIVRTYPVVLVGGVLQENPFYVPPDEFLAELRAREGGSRRAGARKAPDAAEAQYRYVGRLRDTLRDLVALGTLVGGRLAIESEPGKGTRLLLELPLDR